MTELERKKMFNLVDTITGEINRMCVTHDLNELDTMSQHAKKNIEKLQSLRFMADFRSVKNEDRKPVHEYVEDFLNCTNKETCQECKCQIDDDYFICALLRFYRDKLIDRFSELS